MSARRKIQAKQHYILRLLKELVKAGNPSIFPELEVGHYSAQDIILLHELKPANDISLNTAAIGMILSSFHSSGKHGVSKQRNPKVTTKAGNVTLLYSYTIADKE